VTREDLDDGPHPVETSGLCKEYGKLVAVKALDLSIPKGTIQGLLGPNGAGKTTTIRMLCGLTRPTGGSASVLGIDVGRSPERVREVLGIVPQGNVLDRDLTLHGNLVYHARLHRMVPEEYERRIGEVLELVGLEERADDWPLNLSGGMKRRFTIAKALLHSPPVLVLDEPTTGLDPQSRRLIWDKLLQLRGTGITVLLTTHHMEEADELCDDIAVIDQGVIVTEGSPEELKRRHGGGRTVAFVLSGDRPDGGTLRSWGARRWRRKGRRLTVQARDPNRFARTVMEERGDDVLSLHLAEPSLEEVFLNLTGRGLRE
jgi:ABC-type multidrug transport system ATPase subunit